MADLRFKRGVAANLPEKTGAVDGTFYLTTDTERLYVGVGTNLVELNKSIRTVASQSALPTSGVEIGDFYYIKDQNIIAVCTATGTSASSIKWTQVNPDTALSASTSNTSVKLSDKTATVSNSVTDTAGNSSSGSFKITASGNLTMTVSGTEITLSVPDGAKYDLAAAASSTTNAADITLTNQSDSSDKDTVTLKGNDYITVSQKDNVITLEGPAPYNSDVTIKSLSTSTVGSDKSTSGFEIGVTDNGGTVYGTLDPTIVYGSGTTSSAKFSNGTLTLNTYTKDQTDTAINTAVNSAKAAFNAMEYKGTVSSASDLTSKTDQHIGYTYKASGDFTVAAANSSTGAAVSVKTGDLLIAQGTESNGVITSATLKWDVIPSGDEQTITFSTSSSTGVASVSDGNDTAGYKVAAGDKVGVAYGLENGIVTATVSHSKITAPTTKGSTADVTQVASNSATFTAITALTEDGYGHVTGITTKKFTVVDTHNSLGNVDTTVSTTTSDTADIAIKVNSSDGDGGEGNMKITSSTLTLSSSNVASTSSAGAIGTVSINLEWGTF